MKQKAARPGIHTRAMSNLEANIATGRISGLFADDIALCRERISDALKGRRVLIVGGAGSIGSETGKLILQFSPRALHVLDQNENGLAELVRRFHAQDSLSNVPDFKSLPLDYGAPTTRMFLHEQAPYDLVLNFAAIKHVRSEKDTFSTLQMFDTNLKKQEQFLRWLDETNFRGRYFSVSTDKAANPTSMMGATKRVMEHVMFADETTATHASAVTSARFANVAFSNGSLLQSFEQRFFRSEPLAAPIDTRRYFVSLEESGQICLLAATVAPDRSIVIPRLDPNEHLVLLDEIADRFLEQRGFVAARYDSEDEARQNVEHDISNGRWPLLVTPLDTSGEKTYEEFVGEHEATAEIGLPNLLTVAYRPAPIGSVRRLIAQINEVLKDDLTNRHVLDKQKLKLLIAGVEPSFLQTHRETGRNLDDRM